MTHKISGPAAMTIDFFFEEKLRLCKAWDTAFGFSESDVRSMTRFLRQCYKARRPQFELLDRCMAWPNSLAE